MEKWQRIQKPPARRGCDHPSFSSSLLDSIYRSIDDESANRKARDPPPPPPPTIRKKQSPERAPPSLAWVKPPRGAPVHVKKHAPAVTRPPHFNSTTSGSSDCSSYAGYFSSSEPESGTAHSNRLKPIRTGSNHPPPLPLPLPPENKKKNLNSIRNKFRDLKKPRSPTSPAAKLANFLNSLFTSAAGNGRKQKVSAAAPGGQSACTTSSLYSRSCLSKTPSTSEHGFKRSVRFALPVDSGNGRREESRYGRREMRWRDFEAEDDEAASDSSSDLFELENLSAIGRYRDELPVYETTYLGTLLL